MKRLGFKNIAVLFALAFLMLHSCSEAPLPTPEPPEENREQAPVLTQNINDFINLVMEDIYLWYKELPDIDIRYELDPKAYFEKLLYTEDKWSFITDDVEALESSFEGVETTFGYSLAFGRFSNTGDIFALVEFVYPNTPAAEAGIKRGDIIVLMNGDDITDDNYTDLLYAGSLNISLGILGEGGISVSPNSINMTARKLSLNPVLITDIIEHEGHKIGYLFYAQYISNFNSSLDSAFRYFQEQQISDLVVDLRYNPGGGTDAAQHLCSSVAPLSVVNNRSTLVTFQWNDKYQSYWESRNVTSQLKVTFSNTTSVKMGLDKMYVLTGPGTASASELTITGLKPYMNVTTIGESTYGKYTASITFKPEDFLKDERGNGYYDSPADYKNFENWGVQPIVLRYANSQGVTDFKDGFTPDIPVEDELFGALPLGDKQEPLLKAAIEEITGTEILALKKAEIQVSYSIFDRGFSKFDKNKQELLLENY
ncbi:S41 family peptidase [Mariniphaga sp.]|uniref:S41 family peptidase n=1 Tax=Mariniphaga sp. TaxID=1954475 RepID=UPI003564A1C2